MDINQDKTILVVEDEEFNRIYFKELLNKLNCNVIVADNGLKAIEICRTNPSVKLVLMDMKMPIMDGYEATKEIKKIRPDLPVIAQTAFALVGDRNKSLACGCDEYISKPVKRDDLIELILRHI